MEPVFFVKPTRTTPFVTLDPKRKKLIIKGRSAPVASIEFYEQVSTAIEDYLSTNELLSVYIALEYFNTSSGKCLYNLLKELKKYQKDDKKVIVNWLYEEEDDDMKETGEDYMEILDFEFNMKTYTF